MSSSLIGRQLGKYEITELVGQGGMATVYKGYQPDIDRFVAIKVLPPHPGRDPNFDDRFRLEARTVAQLQHPHILPIHDYGTDGEIIYLVTPYLDGGSLKDLIDEGAIPVAETEKLLRQIASALDYAHRRGVIHRDIKPDNILLDSEGNAMLADFGIVKILEGDTGLTATGGVLGTPAYMAPEQSQGTGVTPQADIYALGVIVYEMLAGQQPFQADTPMQVMLKHITDPVPNISDVRDSLPQALSPVMMRVLAKNPEDRYQSASEFSQAFLRAMHNNEPFLTDTRSQTPTRETVMDPTEAVPQMAPPAMTSSTMTPSSVQGPIVVQEIPSARPASAGGVNTNTVIIVAGMAIIALLAVIVVLLVVNSNGRGTTTVLAPTQAPPTATAIPATQPVLIVPTSPGVKNFGTLSFSTTAALGDTVNVQVNGLEQPPSGREFALWLKNTSDDSILPIGTLNVDGLGNGIHQFVDSEGRDLPTLFNAMLITGENENEVGDAPSGDVIYSGMNPDNVRDALYEIFMSSPEGFSDGSLFGGALKEAELAVIHTSFDHGTHDLFGLKNRTEHTMNILMNTLIDYDGNDLAENPGFKIGVPPMLDAMEARLNFDFSTPGLRPNLRSDVVRVEACLHNVRNRLNDLYKLETGWAQMTDEVSEVLRQSEIRKSESMINGMIEGVDMNSNGQIEGFPGECGLRQIPAFGLLIGTLDVLEGDSNNL